MALEFSPRLRGGRDVRTSTPGTYLEAVDKDFPWVIMAGIIAAISYAMPAGSLIGEPLDDKPTPVEVRSVPKIHQLD